MAPRKPELTPQEIEARAKEEADLAVVAQWREPRSRKSINQSAHFTLAISPPVPLSNQPNNQSSNQSNTQSSLLANQQLVINAAPLIAHQLRFRTAFRNTIYQVLLERGWKETSDEVNWHVHWTGKDWIKSILPKIHLSTNQSINHFRNYYELTRKDLLVKNLKRAKVVAARNLALTQSNTQPSNQTNSQSNNQAINDLMCNPEKFDFFCETYNLPHEYLLFVDAFKRYQAISNQSNNQSSNQPTPHNLWIAKPIGSSQGKGIFLFDKLSAVSDWSDPNPSSNVAANHAINQSNNQSDNANDPENDEPPLSEQRYIVQRYIADPMLVGSKKFDMRIYVLVTNYEPLNVYIHREAFARFSTTRYESLNQTNTNQTTNPPTNTSSEPPNNQTKSSSNPTANNQSKQATSSNQSKQSIIANSYMHLTNVAIQKEGPDYDAISGGKLVINQLKNLMVAQCDEQYALDDMILSINQPNSFSVAPSSQHLNSSNNQANNQANNQSNKQSNNQSSSQKIVNPSGVPPTDPAIQQLVSNYLAKDSSVNQCFTAITELILYSLLSVKPVMIKDRHCFELYGYDVLIDQWYKPWLIEVNASPSLTANTREDEQLKKAMLHDTFHVLEVERWITDKLNNAKLSNSQPINSSSKPTNAKPVIGKKDANQSKINQASKATSSVTSTTKQPNSSKPAPVKSSSIKQAGKRSNNQSNNQSINQSLDPLIAKFYGGDFDRIGGFDCIYREQYGGLRCERPTNQSTNHSNNQSNNQYRAQSRLGDHNDRDAALHTLWKRMAAYDQQEREQNIMRHKQARAQAEHRSQQREQKRTKKK